MSAQTLAALPTASGYVSFHTGVSRQPFFGSVAELVRQVLRHPRRIVLVVEAVGLAAAARGAGAVDVARQHAVRGVVRGGAAERGAEEG